MVRCSNPVPRRYAAVKAVDTPVRVPPQARPLVKLPRLPKCVKILTSFSAKTTDSQTIRNVCRVSCPEKPQRHNPPCSGRGDGDVYGVARGVVERDRYGDVSTQ